MQIITNNRPNTDNNINTKQCAKSPPDSYTICIISITQTISPSIYPKLNFDPIRDFAHITLLTTLPNLLLIHPSLPTKNIKELITLAKAKPGALNYASNGSSTSSQMLMELFKLNTNINIVHIPYKNTRPALIDQLSGQIEIAFSTIITTLPYTKTNRLRTIAVSTKKRFPQLPNIPTIDESNLKGFNDDS